LTVKINGNSGAQQEISVSTKVSKEIVPFEQEFAVQECDVKNDPTELLESKSNKEIRLRLPMLLGIRLQLLSTPTQQPWSLPLQLGCESSRHNILNQT